VSVAVVHDVVPGPWQRGAEAAGDLLGMVGVVVCIPFVIIAVAAPVVLFADAVVWIIGKL